MLESHRVWTSWQEWDQTPREGRKESQKERETMSIAQYEENEVIIILICYISRIGVRLSAHRAV